MLGRQRRWNIAFFPNDPYSIIDRVPRLHYSTPQQTLTANVFKNIFKRFEIIHMFLKLIFSTSYVIVFLTY